MQIKGFLPAWLKVQDHAIEARGANGDARRANEAEDRFYSQMDDEQRRGYALLRAAYGSDNLADCKALLKAAAGHLARAEQHEARAEQFSHDLTIAVMAEGEQALAICVVAEEQRGRIQRELQPAGANNEAA